MAAKGVSSISTGRAAPRRYDLDWLRIIAVFLLVPFHSALVFSLDPGKVAYVRDAVQSDLILQMADFVGRWQLELLFFIAGSATWFSLGRRSSGRYLLERVTRLLVPFLFGLFALIPLMINVRYLGQPDAPSLGQIYGGFLKMGNLTGMDGHFTPAHLWFIMYLFLFSAVALPIFQLLRHPAAERALAWTAAWPGTVYLFFIPMFLAKQADIFGLGDKDLLYYLLVFVAGYVVFTQPRFQETIDRYLPLSLGLALAATLLPPVLWPGTLERGSAAQVAAVFVFRLSMWTWVLAILGAGHRWLNRESRHLRYLGEAAYPFYILHLPVDTLVAFYVIQLGASVGVKYALVVVVTTLLTLAVYEVVVRRLNPLRFLFGMKALARKAEPRRQPAY